MALILSIETSTKVCSVALHQKGKLLASKELFLEKSHSALLSTLIDELLKSCRVQFSNLEAIAVSKGPGSYTGLRIGVSTAKGLCYALGVPLIAVNTLEAMAYGVNQFNLSNALLCPMIDARRMEVYCLIADTQMGVIEPTHAKIIDETSFSNLLVNHDVLFFGDGASKCQDVLGHNANAKFLNSISPSAVNTGYLAGMKFLKEDFEDLAYFEPFYLKDFRVTKPKAK
ncbi:tRNA (adenosine(37)-N6)-threonylcarbamoyltransferase complex dimerization subunit type 1 TsaB [Xanthovirga aplysinae]|uniref:tRNA (adenosine(37)-N6)-threonylcarbamoyltransferase complex dimerization subunit type 1 TsaB n=1 Tax=Xanthovirga aplysinae TaxID=2529853 RepID=UPI0012BCA4A0|nr:tRNA (adenosine(37)-N6)-threonylcarbamoyltransferase complex dimerization subunit type 1 TsaB [Xanthovirga aplysinae]MTI31325.1 tRNA (adenosine(37)-N6)-threonylcarbamoyltransferase complex dimerization subunit type 1 TsaB [Xanthovirga aplysinae]